MTCAETTAQLIPVTINLESTPLGVLSVGADFSRLRRPREPMPDFVRAALEEHGLMDSYRERPAYQQNDYLRWINEAKRQATKEKRLRQMLDELREGGVYMGMEHPASARSRRAARPSDQGAGGAAGEAPAIVNASDQELAAILGRYQPELRQVFLEVHRIIRQCLPDINYATNPASGGTGYGARQYGYDGWGIFALSVHKRWVSLYFMRGVELDDPDDVLEGSGKQMRHIKFRSVEEFTDREEALRRLIQQAAQLNG